jgi:hypothetical protein
MRLTLEHAARLLLPTVETGRALSRGEWWTLVRVAEVLLEGAAVEITAEDVADNVERFLIAGRSRRAWRVRVLLRAIEVTSFATHGRGFSRLTHVERRGIVLERWTSGRHVWRLCSKVRNLVILGAYGDRRAARTTGYVPVQLRPRFRAESVRMTGGAA